jgi:hypothetical protein
VEATKEAYMANMGQTVKVGRYTCEVGSKRKDGRSGSYERGFKFTSSTYGYLKTTTKARGTEFSFDHGRTWHWNILQASKVRSGKILLERDAPRGEFAFDAIQKINRDYDPSYKWKA